MLRLLFLAALSLKISVAFMPYYEFTIKGNLNCEPVPGKKINVNAIVEAWEADTSKWIVIIRIKQVFSYLG
jgi:hypothetical protein